MSTDNDYETLLRASDITRLKTIAEKAAMFQFEIFFLILKDLHLIKAKLGIDPSL